MSVVDDHNGNCDEFSSDDEQGRAHYDDKLTVFEESLRWPATNSRSINSAGHTHAVYSAIHAVHTVYMYAAYGTHSTWIQ